MFWAYNYLNSLNEVIFLSTIFGDYMKNSIPIDVKISVCIVCLYFFILGLIFFIINEYFSGIILIVSTVLVVIILPIYSAELKKSYSEYNENFTSFVIFNSVFFKYYIRGIYFILSFLSIILFFCKDYVEFGTAICCLGFCGLIVKVDKKEGWAYQGKRYHARMPVVGRVTLIIIMVVLFVYIYLETPFASDPHFKEIFHNTVMYAQFFPLLVIDTILTLIFDYLNERKNGSEFKWYWQLLILGVILIFVFL